MVFGSLETSSSSSFEFSSLSEAHQEAVSHSEGDTPAQLVVEAAATVTTSPITAGDDNDESLLEDATRSASSSSGVQLAQHTQRWADMDDSEDCYFQYFHRKAGDNAEELTEVAEVTAELPCKEPAVSEASVCSSPDFGGDDASTDASSSEQASEVDPDDVCEEGTDNTAAVLEPPCSTPNQFDFGSDDDYAEGVDNIDAAPEPACPTPNQFDPDSDDDDAQGADHVDVAPEPPCLTPDQFHLDSDNDYAEDAENINAAVGPPCCSTPNLFDRSSSLDSAGVGENIALRENQMLPGVFEEFREEPPEFGDPAILPGSWYVCESTLHTAYAAWCSQVDPSFAMCPQYYPAAAFWGCMPVAVQAVPIPLPVMSAGPSHEHLHPTSVQSSCEATAIASFDFEIAETSSSDWGTAVANSSTLSQGQRAAEPIHGPTVSLVETKPQHRRRRSDDGQRKQRERHFRRLEQRAERRAKQLAAASETAV